MSYEIEAPIGGEHEYVTDRALAGLVGQRPTVDGSPGEVVAAWRDEHGHAWIRVRAEGELPDVSGIAGRPVTLGEWSMGMGNGG